MNRSETRLLAGVAASALALCLGGCGKLGSLERPAPLFGEQAQRDYNAEQAARAEAARDRKAREDKSKAAADQPDPNADNAPPSTRQIEAPDQKLTSPRQDPIEGIPNPLGAPPSLTPPN